MKAIFSLIMILSLWLSAMNDSYACAHKADIASLQHCSCLQVVPFGFNRLEFKICKSCGKPKCHGQPTHNPTIGNSISHPAAFVLVVIPSPAISQLASWADSPQISFAQRVNPPPLLVIPKSKVYLEKNSLLI